MQMLERIIIWLYHIFNMSSVYGSLKKFYSQPMVWGNFKDNIANCYDNTQI